MIVCKYCEGPGLTCLHCARVCMLEKWREHAERCKMCKGEARERLGDLPRFAFCPYCGRELPAYLPDGEEKPPEKRQIKRNWKKEEVAALIRMRQNRVKIKDCAEALGRSEKQVMNKLGELLKNDGTRTALGLKPKPKDQTTKKARKKADGKDKNG